MNPAMVIHLCYLGAGLVLGACLGVMGISLLYAIRDFNEINKDHHG